ncbi:Uncharacterised protein [uncultured archaeon]|nr:Uncharacterised protein [uncultured archaeon]
MKVDKPFGCKLLEAANIMNRIPLNVEEAN